jgi:hypothetical protein
MRSGTPYVVAFVIASASAVAACGSEEVFEPQLASGEQLIDRAAVAWLAKDDEGIEDVSVVGDLDGDGIDDAVVRTSYLIQSTAPILEIGSTVYVVYGGTATGKVDLSTLPRLTGVWGGRHGRLGRGRREWRWPRRLPGWRRLQLRL